METKKLTAMMLALLVAFSIVGAVYVFPARATHEPQITIIPEYTKGIWPEWVNFTVYNAEGDPIVEVKISHPVEYKPIEFTMPYGFIADYMPEQRLVEFISTNPSIYNIPEGKAGIFGLKAEKGPIRECEYEFIISTTDMAGQGYVFYMTQKVDKTSPHVVLVQPTHHSTVEAQFDPEKKLYYIDVYVEAYDIGVHPSGIYKVELYFDDLKVTDNMTFINTLYHLWYWKLFVGKSKNEVQGYHKIKAIGYDRSYKDGNSAKDEIEITITSKPQLTISPTEGYVGTTVTVKGHGFSENEDVWIVYRDVSKGEVYYWPAFDSNGTHLIRWYPHLDSVIVKELKSDDKGQFITEFEVPYSYGYYHAIYAGEQEIIDYRDGRYYFKQESYCRLFEVKPRVWTDQKEAMKGEYITIYGSGLPLPRFTWCAFDANYYFTGWNLCLAIDFGPEKYWVKEDTHQLNGFTDNTASWYAGETYPFSFHDPLRKDSPVWAGNLTWRHDIIYELGSPWLKVPTLSVGEYTIKVYQYGSTYERWNEMIKEWHGDNTYFMAETSIRIIADPLTGEATLVGIEENIATIIDQMKTILVNLHELGDVTLEIKENAIIINTKLGDISSSLDALGAKIVKIDESVATIDTKLGKIKIDLESINAKIVEIKDGVATIKTDLGEITSSLDVINAEVVEINKGVVTIRTDLGEITSSLDAINAEIIEIKDGVATLSTDVGKIDTKVENLKGTSMEIHEKTGELNTEIGLWNLGSVLGLAALILGGIYVVRKGKKEE